MFKRIFLFVIFAATVWGQGFSASVLGTVTDNTGGVVARATVTVTNLGTGQQQVLTTDANGAYQAPLLPPSPYMNAYLVM